MRYGIMHLVVIERNDRTSERREQLQGAEVVKITRYPIKSCGGEDLQRAEVTKTGIKHDRELMLIFPNGKMVSQRDRGCEKLALVKPHIDDNGNLTAMAPGMENQLHLAIHHKPSTGSQPKEAMIHKTQGIQVIEQPEGSKWFREYLGQEVQLVAMADGYQRQVSQRWAPRTTDVVGFADGYNFLIISQESLDGLNNRLPQIIDMDSFRPNIVFKGNGVAHSEDEMAQVQINDVLLDGVKPCIRCNITMVEQDKGSRRVGDMRKEPLATLARYRMTTLRTGDRGPIFGENFVNENTGTIRLGDKVKVLKTKPPEPLE